MKKPIIIILIVCITVLFFVDRCTTVNLTTADIFRPESYNHFKNLTQKPQSKSYEIIPAKGSFPVLYDKVNNVFYIRNGQGLTKYDAVGNVIISNDLSKEKYTSTFDFANFVPYVFAQNGIYDFSGKTLFYSKFSQVLNAENELSDQDFKSIFETNYRNADLVIYDTNRNVDSEKDCQPMYFKIKDEWILMFSQKGDYRFSHQGSNDVKNDTIGQIDFLGFPSKFADKRLMVLKDSKNAIFSIRQMGKEDITDDYLNTYYTQILKERKTDYSTNDNVKLLSRRKDDYYFTGNPFGLPDWVSPSFMNTGFFRLNYRGEHIYFKEKAVKMSSDSKVQNDFYIYELPQKYRAKSKLAFLHYSLDVGGYMNDSTQVVEPIVRNAGLYLIKPKK